MRGLDRRVSFAFLLALILTIIPLPEVLMGARPPWVLLLSLYLQFYRPTSFNLSVLVFLGLALDVLLSTVLGEHVFALTFVTFFANSKARRFYFFSIGQQMGLIAVFTLLYQFVLCLIDGFLGFKVQLIGSASSVLLSIMLWPWIRLAAEEFLRNEVKK